MFDSKDYAPNDPDVQKKSDLASDTAKETTTTSTETSPTTTIEPTTVTTTTTTTEQTSSAVYTDTIQANFKPLEGRTDYFRGYSLTQSQITIEPDTLIASYPNGARVYVEVFSHPHRETLYGVQESDTFDIQESPFTVTASISETKLALPNQETYLIALLLPADVSLEEATGADVEKLAETNRFTVTGTGITLNPHPASLGSASTDTFTRTAGEGKFMLEFSGTTQGRNWSANYVIHKSIYIEKVIARRGRSRKEYIAVAQQSGFADTLGRIIEQEAVANGFTTKQEKAAFLIDFVLNFPYVTDDVSKDFDDYTKFMTETLTEASGDCEDTSILLAALLQPNPFNYDSVLLLLPGHMAVGVYGEDLPGYYWEYNGRRYYYLEITGQGWGVGDLPEQHQNEQVRIYDV